MTTSAVTFVDKRLCYTGQNCQMIPQSLMHIYGPKVESLDLSYNDLIEDLSSLLSKICTNLPKLTYLSLLGNKACPNELSGDENDENDYQRYRCYVLYHIKNLKFLDSRKVNDTERCEALRRGKFMNVIKPSRSVPFTDIEVPLTIENNHFNPLPKNIRCPDDFKGVYGKCQYRYSGKHSEGNRFISNNDL
ncbi:leucine-rich melanocyte differentiation-associated protein isoform X2 [Diabrotica undecimpunctata]|uniref:leucine-rich melanocyte differentiation-associated protein isoform X2 n=1 Tax=Diabrotica undecimpunctata TaxID=50387 RepID=UPI003B63ACCA